MASARRKRKVLTLGLKNRPQKIDEFLIFAPKGAPFIFWQELKKSRRSNEYFERYSHKNMRGGQNLLLLSSARVNDASFTYQSLITIGPAGTVAGPFKREC